MQSLSARQLFDLTGKVFLVVGGARNLGRDMATAIAEAGAHGTITSREESSAREAAREMAAATGKQINGLALEATDEPAVIAAVARVLDNFGRIDILINNVGGAPLRPGAGIALEERELEDWEHLLRINQTAVFLLCKHVLPVMKLQGSGCIINIASIAGMVGRDRRVYPPDMMPQTIDYACAKAGVLGLSRDLAAYAGPHGVRVNVISPGGFERGQPPEFVDAYSSKCPLGRMGRDGIDLKGAAVFLASDASAYVTGLNLVVDGGFTIWQ